MDRQAAAACGCREVRNLEDVGALGGGPGWLAGGKAGGSLQGMRNGALCFSPEPFHGEEWSEGKTRRSTPITFSEMPVLMGKAKLFTTAGSDAERSSRASLGSEIVLSPTGDWFTNSDRDKGASMCR